MTGDMTITLEGERGQISAAALQTALACSLRLVREAGEVLGATAGQWNVADLQVGSVTFALANPAAPGAATLVRAGLEVLSSRSLIPPQWNQKMVRKARDMGRLPGVGGVHEVVVSTPGEPALRLSGALTANAEQALQAREVSLASVQGLVDKWDERRGHQIGITLDGGETITASYPADIADRIREQALGRQIEARGELWRNAEGQRVQLLMRDFMVLSTDPPMGIEALAGLYRELGDAGVTAMDVLGHRE